MLDTDFRFVKSAHMLHGIELSDTSLTLLSKQNSYEISKDQRDNCIRTEGAGRREPGEGTAVKEANQIYLMLTDYMNE